MKSPLNADHDLLLVILGITVFFLIFVIGLIIFIVNYNREQRAFARQKEKSEREYKDALEKTQQEIRAELLRNVSDEIHDNLGQVASLIKIYVNTLQVNDTQLSQHEELKTLVSRLIYDLKTLSLNVHPDYIVQAGLVSALENDINRLKISGILDIHYEKNAAALFLNSDLQVIIYRLFQESVHNVIRHAEASSLHITLNSSEEEFSFSVKDNGRGFSLPEFQPESGSGKSGITNMYRRSEAIGGTLRIVSNDTGTEVAFTLLKTHLPQ